MPNMRKANMTRLPRAPTVAAFIHFIAIATVAIQGRTIEGEETEEYRRRIVPNRSHSEKWSGPDRVHKGGACSQRYIGRGEPGDTRRKREEKRARPRKGLDDVLSSQSFVPRIQSRHRVHDPAERRAGIGEKGRGQGP
jgi:hypothetical protein